MTLISHSSLRCVFCAFLSAAARPQGCTRSQGTKKKTLRTSGGPRCSECRLWSWQHGWWWGGGGGGRWAHKSAWAGLREFEGQCFTGRSEGPLPPRPAQRSRCHASLPPPPPASVHPPKSAASTPCLRLYGPVISTYGRCMAAVPSVKPGVRSAGALM